MSLTIPLTLKSQRACTFCRDRKQSCDKLLPRCSRCHLKDRHCDYSLNKSPRRNETISSLSQQAPGSIITVCDPCGCLEVRREAGTCGLGQSGSPDSDGFVVNTSDISVEQVFWSVIDTESDGKKGIIDRYFGTVHRWLPIISKEVLFNTFDKPRSHLNDSIDTNSFLLFLCMRLVTQGRCSASCHKARTNSFYLVTRRLFLLCQEEHWSLALLQAGVLIATYECGHGLTKSSYLTLASCVALARLMRIDQDLAPQLNAGPDDVADPKVLCWSAIVVLDRQLALASVHGSFPLLVPPPADSCFDASLECLQTRLAASKQYERNHWSFESTAAAAEMIGEALTYAPSGSTVPAERLDLVRSRTEKLVTVLLSISQIEPILTCEIAPLAISALAAVRLRCAATNDERCISGRSVEELRSTFNMKLDEIRMGPDQLTWPQVNGISLLVLCSVFRSVLHLARYFQQDLLAADVARIKSGLLILREHWAIGDLYSDDLDDILALSKQ